MVKCQVIELGFRINPNKSLSLTCVWVVTHIRVVLGEIHGRFLKKYMYLKEDLSRKEMSR